MCSQMRIAEFEPYFMPELAGCEALVAPAWQPQPHILARVQSYLKGFAAHGRQIYARRHKIAAKLSMKLRTLARYLAWLTEIGWLTTVKRTPRTVIRVVSLPGTQATMNQQFETSNGTSLGTSSEVTAEGKAKPTTEKHTPLS